MNELYGDMPITATKEIVDIWKNDNLKLYEVWASLGKFLYDYYGKDENKKVIDKAAGLMNEAYINQHHSGGSHGVVTQCIMEYLSGKMSEKEKRIIKPND